MLAVCNIFGNEKLRAVGVRTRIGHRQPAGTIELERRYDFVFEGVAGIAASVSGGIAALDHEFGNHAMENRPVVERRVVFGGMAHGIGPVFGAGGEVNEILDCDWSFFLEQRTAKLADRSVEDGRGLTRSGCWMGRRMSGGRLGSGSRFGGSCLRTGVRLRPGRYRGK